MSAAGNAMQFAGDLFLVCMLISIGVIIGRMSNKMSQASATVINQNTVEYLDADVSSLMASKHSGIQVRNYISKYRRSMQIEVTTKKSAESGQNPLAIDATTSISPLTDKSSVYYLTNDATFSCTADKDSNGYYMRLKFVQDTDEPVGIIVGDVQTADQAKLALKALLNSREDATWTEIVDQLRLEITDNKQAKEELLQSIKDHSSTPGVTADSNWDALVNRNDELLTEFGDAVKTMGSVKDHNKTNKTLECDSDLVLNFSPDVVIATDNETGETFLWTNYNGVGWIVGSPSIGVAGNTIKNSSTSQTYSIVAYN